METKKETRGRKAKYGEPTAVLHFRIPATKEIEIKKKVMRILEPYKKKATVLQ